MAGIGTQSVPACDPPPECRLSRSSSGLFLAGATRPAEVRYERLFEGRKSGHLKKVKYTGLTSMDPAGVRSKS
jgi:hypothetical protein